MPQDTASSYLPRPDSTGAAGRANARELAIFCLFFFISGACGLAYEVIWTRLFGLTIGNVTITLSAVLTAFMSGLALGSWLAGRLFKRMRHPLAVYGALELGVALTAVLIPSLIQLSRIPLAAVYRLDMPPGVQNLVRFAVAGLIMLPPTTLMGATLPILTGYFTRSKGEIGSKTGLLYAINTFGAMFGAALTGLVLIPRLGMSHIIHGAAAFNALVGLSSLALSRKAAGESIETAPHTPGASVEVPETSRRDARIIAFSLVAIGISGAASMSLQVAWTRLFALMIGSSTYSFTLVVVVTIGCLALGARMFGNMADRVRNPAMLLAALFVCAGFWVFGTLWTANILPQAIYRLLGSGMNAGGVFFEWILLQEFCLIGLYLFGVTFCLGGAIPVVARLAAGRYGNVSAAVGAVYAVNTAGAVIGAALAGLLLMPLIKLRGIFLLSGILLAGLGAVAFSTAARRRPRGLAGAMAILALLAAGLWKSPPWNPDYLTSNPYLRSLFQDQSMAQTTVNEIFDEIVFSSDLLYYREGLPCTVSVKKSLSDSSVYLEVNGKTDASSGSGDMPMQLLLGHLPALFHPDPQTICVIGLGGGFTLGGAAREAGERVDCVEISKDVRQAVKLYFDDKNGWATLQPKSNIIIADGRNHLALTDKKYDVIVSEPSNPWIAGIGNLFTTDFFRLAKSRLNPGGIYGQWIQVYSITTDDVMMIIGSLLDVFPHAVLWQCSQGDYILLGSDSELKLDWNQLEQRLNRPEVSGHLGLWSNLNDIHVFLSGFAGTDKTLREAAGAYRRNTDDYPRLEFSAPMSLYDESITMSFAEENFYWAPLESILVDSSIPPREREWVSGHLKRKTRIADILRVEAKTDSGRALGELLAINQENPKDSVVGDFLLVLLNAYGESAIENGDLDGAARTMKLALRLHEEIGPDNNHSLYIRTIEDLGWIYFLENKIDAALDTYGQAYASGMGGIVSRMLAASLWIDKGRPDKTLRMLMDGLPIAVIRQEQFLSLAAYASACLGEFPLIGNILDNRMMRLRADLEQTAIWQIAQSIATARTGANGAALRPEVIEAAQPGGEGDASFRALVAEALRLNGDSGGAAELFESLCSGSAVNALAGLGLAELRLDQESPDDEEAAGLLDQIAPLSQHNPRFFFLSARLAEARGELDKARDFADAAEQLLDGWPAGWIQNWSYGAELRAMRARIGGGTEENAGIPGETP